MKKYKAILHSGWIEDPCETSIGIIKFDNFQELLKIINNVANIDTFDSNKNPDLGDFASDFGEYDLKNNCRVLSEDKMTYMFPFKYEDYRHMSLVFFDQETIDCLITEINQQKGIKQ